MQRLIRNFRFLGRVVFRYTLVWVADAISIGFTALVMPGIYFLREVPFWYLHPFVVALLFGLMNALVRPVLVLLLLPITFVTLGLATLAVNAALFYLMDAILQAFVVETFLAAVVGVMVLTLVNTLLGSFIPLRDDYSFYATMLDKFTRLTSPRDSELEDRGVVILQIDGLSYRTFKRAVQRGKMPFVGTMLKRRRSSIRRYFSGLPSQTSAIQSAMFYGTSYDIPGFRWYDKKANRMVESSNASDMRDIDERLGAGGDSILARGSCINSLVHGNAYKKLLTISSLSDRDILKHRGELEDFAIFTLHPYLYTRTILLMIWDFLVDRAQAAWELLRRKKPRLVRTLKFSAARAIGNACLREITTFFVREDIVRGIPVIYANYIGYDMVAHYAGPNSWDALNTLTGIDRHIKGISRTMRRRASKHYDLIVLSDHGQSECIAFETMFGQPLEDVISKRLQDRPVDKAGSAGELGYLSALLREMRFVEESFARAPLRGSRRTLERLHARMSGESTDGRERAPVVVCPSGGLAHVYFTDESGRLTTEYFLERYPDLLAFLVSHPGIGFVITRDSAGEYLMMGRAGMRNLATGKVEGEDPLEAYAKGRHEEPAAGALLEMSSYPSSGDLILNGAMLGDGRVVSFENQRGTHGGLGGEQTEPFIVYPGRFRRREDRVDNPTDLHGFIKGLIPA